MSQNATKIGLEDEEYTWKEYVDLAIRTKSTLNPLTNDVNERGLNADVLHGVIGLATENDELRIGIENMDHPNIKEELGDMFWYIAIITRGLKIDHEWSKLVETRYNEIESIDDIMELERCIAELLDIVKRVMFYGTHYNGSSFEKHLKDLYLNLIVYIGFDEELDYQEILKLNINKLKARYPNKFNMDNSINRDLEAERKVLEGE